MKYSTLLLLLLFPLYLNAQKIDYPDDFRALLDRVGIDFFEPLEAGYKDIRPVKNDFQTYQFAIFSRKEDLEMRYFIQPFDKQNPISGNPHVLTMRSLTTLATNDQEKYISSIQLEEEVLKRDFNADWGMVYFFRPKEGFSTAFHCRMLALYKEGKGTVFVFYLFERTDNEALDKRYYALRFKDDSLN